MSPLNNVLVVGAGPTGLIMALSLLRNGVSVRIIEKASKPHGGARGTAIQPRSLEMLSFLGVAQDVFAIATRPLLLAVYGPDGKIVKTPKWAEDAGQSPTIPFPELASLSQAELEIILREHIASLGGKVEYGLELNDLQQTSEKVTAHLRSLASDTDTSKELEVYESAYLIAADGAKGRIRSKLGLTFLGETKESERILTANVHASGAVRDHWNMWGNLQISAFGLKPLNPAPLFQLQMLRKDQSTPLQSDLQGIQKLCASVEGAAGVTIEKAEWVSEWRANMRMVDKYNVGRVFLAGDCAHCHSPAGGQGCNTAMQDSFNLAWKLALVLHGTASSKLLESYSTERIPVAAELLNLTNIVHSSIWPRGASALDTGKPTQVEDIMFRPKRLLQLGVNCRWSPIVLDERENITDSAGAPVNAYGLESEHVRAGDRAPDATELARATSSLEPITLHSLFDVTKHSILIFGNTSTNFSDLQATRTALRQKYSRLGNLFIVIPMELRHSVDNASVDLVILDIAGHARAAYGIRSADAQTLVVVRPDGIIGAYALSDCGVDSYFSKLLA